MMTWVALVCTLKAIYRLCAYFELSLSTASLSILYTTLLFCKSKKHLLSRVIKKKVYFLLLG